MEDPVDRVIRQIIAVSPTPTELAARIRRSLGDQPGGRETATNPWGVLSGIVLGARVSRVQGEGPDRSTLPAKETRAGQVGLGSHEPTSLRATALGRTAYAQASTTEEPDAGNLHVRVSAGGAG